MIAEQYPGLLDLSDEEKLQLASELWHDVIGETGEPEDPALIVLMEARLAEYRTHPKRVSAWEDAKARLLKEERTAAPVSAGERVYSDKYYEAIAASMGQEAADWARLPRAEREKVLTWYHMNFNTPDDLSVWPAELDGGTDRP